VTQLPWYDLATNALAHFGRHYISRGGVVYDIGASTGNIGRALKDTLDELGARFTAIEGSRETAERYDGPPELVIADAVRFDFQPFDFAVCFLVLMFLPVDTRAAFLCRLESLTKPGGALVVVDKFQMPPGYVGTAFSRLTLPQKLAVGARPEDILRKELSLAGYQRPLDPGMMCAASQIQRMSSCNSERRSKPASTARSPRATMMPSGKDCIPASRMPGRLMPFSSRGQFLILSTLTRTSSSPGRGPGRGAAGVDKIKN
jgi:tRNA (cmo5U34)-methyltransferase